MAKKQQMTESELVALLDAQLHNAMGYIGGELSEQRKLALDYYHGEPFGNEVEGRSKIISTDVADAVEWMLPSLIDIFTASESAVKFNPVTPDDTKKAEQDTDYINHVFFNDNQGFLVLYTLIKDALLQKNGYVKVFWEKTEEKKRETYEDLDDLQFLQLMSNPNVEALEHDEIITQVESPMGVIEERKHNVVLQITNTQGGVKIVNVPPEEIFITRNANSVFLDNVDFVCHRTTKTVTELLDMGFDRKKIESLPNAQENDREEKIARRNLDDEQHTETQQTDASMRRITVEECYVRVDYDGDGLGELRKITKSHNVILDNEAIDAIPIIAATPIINTHKHFGISIADLVMDLQLIKSTLMRQTLDNIYLINNPRHVVNELTVNMEDLLVVRPGSPVRTRGAPGEAIVPLTTQPLTDLAYNALEYLDRIAAGRTGVSQASKGLDPDILKNNKGDQSVAMLMTAAEKRVALIARILAETSIKTIFLKIYELNRKHQDKERVIQLRNEWVNVNPRDWAERNDAAVSVGLGTGDQNKQVNTFSALLNIQQTMVQNGGLNILVNPKNIYNAVIDLSKYSGIRNPELYFTDPESQEVMQLQQQQAQNPQKDPTTQALELQAQVQHEKNQIMAQELQLKNQELQLKNKEIELDHKIKEQQLLLNAKKDQDDSERKNREMLTKVYEMIVDTNTRLRELDRRGKPGDMPRAGS